MKRWMFRMAGVFSIALTVASGIFGGAVQTAHAQSGNYLWMHTESNCTSSPSTTALLVNQGGIINSFGASNNNFSCAKVTWRGNINVQIYPNMNRSGTAFQIVRVTGSNPGEVISFLGNAIDNNSESMSFN